MDQAKIVERMTRRLWFLRELEAHPACRWLNAQRIEGFNSALAQHYGVPTGYIDLSESFDVACFFATCRYVAEDGWQPCASGVGVIYFLPIQHIPVRPDALQPIGLQVLPRPREQWGWVVVCGINCDFEDIPGLMMLEFEHDINVSNYFLEKFSRGADLFPTDAMAEVAAKVVKSTVLPRGIASVVIRDLCNQKDGLSSTPAELHSMLESYCELKEVEPILGAQLLVRAEQEWEHRRESFLRHVGFRLVRSLGV